jgi:diguanylate cyclase (GGDEF)-like protein
VDKHDLARMQASPSADGRSFALPRLNGNPASGFWDDIPASSWVMTLQNGQIRFQGAHPGAAGVSDLASVHHEVLAARLLEHAGRGHAAPLRLQEILPAPDGTLHHFLVIGHPVGGSNGSPAAYLAGLAIDVTHYQERVTELAQMALQDELTSLYNLRGFTLFAEHELKVAHRRRTLSAVVYVDLDGLKGVNDSRGHNEGNALLVATAALLRAVFRECDVIGRLGGDEFAVFASDLKGDPAYLAKRLRAEIPVAGVIPGSPTGLAVSIGVASRAPGATTPLAELVAAADQAMYRDKARKAGRVPVVSGKQ